MPIGLNPDFMPIPLPYAEGQIWYRPESEGKIRITNWATWAKFQSKMYVKPLDAISYPSQWPVLLPYEDISMGNADVGPHGKPQFWMQHQTLVVQGWELLPHEAPIQQFDNRPAVLARTWPKGGDE